MFLAIMIALYIGIYAWTHRPKKPIDGEWLPPEMTVDEVKKRFISLVPKDSPSDFE